MSVAARFKLAFFWITCSLVFLPTAHAHDFGPTSTHLDPIQNPFRAGSIVESLLAPEPIPPLCATDYYFRALIAYPTDAAQNKSVAAFRTDLGRADATFSISTALSSGASDAALKFKCNGSALVDIPVVLLQHNKAYYRNPIPPATPFP